MTPNPFGLPGYNCSACGYWVSYGQTHVCMPPVKAPEWQPSLGGLNWVPYEHKPSQRELIATAILAAKASRTVEFHMDVAIEETLRLTDALIAALGTVTSAGNES